MFKQRVIKVVCCCLCVFLLGQIASCSINRSMESEKDISREEFEANYHIKGRRCTIDYSGDSDIAIAQFEQYADFQYVSESDRAKFLLVAEYIREFPYSYRIEYWLVGNSYEDKYIHLDYICFGHSLVQRTDPYANIEITDRIGILWLNNEIDECYCYGDYLSGLLYYVSLCGSISDNNDDYPSAEELKNNTTYEWIKTVETLDYSKSSNSAERSTDNYYIIDLLIDNYFNYNCNLKDATASDNVLDDVFGFHHIDFRLEMYKIYKQYGNAVFGSNVDGVYVIDNYDEMYGELDKQIMEAFDLKLEDFR